MSLLTAMPFKIFSTALTSSFKRKSASLFFLILQINFQLFLIVHFPGPFGSALPWVDDVSINFSSLVKLLKGLLSWFLSV